MRAMALRALLVSIYLITSPLPSIADQISAVTGAGSSFIYPVLAQWTKAYEKATGVEINYQDIGSGGGIQQLTNGTVDFAASDMPLDTATLKKNNWIQFPMVSGGIVAVVNIKHIQSNQLNLSGETLADIYLGKIKFWDDKALQTINKNLHLPHARLITVRRADGSGTTFNFTNYLSKVSPTWKAKAGSNTLVQWPSFGIGAKGNAGVAAQVQKMPNSIGYVEYTYAIENNMTIANMINAAGKVVNATHTSFKASAENAKWSDANQFQEILTNEPGAQSWPIVATTYIMMPVMARHPAISKLALDFFRWSFKHGQMAVDVGYVSMPTSVTHLIEKQWQRVFGENKQNHISASHQ